MNRPVAIIVIAQFLGTSLWFSANSTAHDLQPLPARGGEPRVARRRRTALVRPVRLGDTLRLKSTVLETRASASRPDMGTICARSEVYNQHGELVMHMSSVGMFRRRNPGE